MTSVEYISSGSEAEKAERMLRYHLSRDVATDEAIASDLLKRAEALLHGSPSQINPAPRDMGQPYEKTVAFVRSRCVMDEWTMDRIARRIWVTGESLWHACWVITGSQSGRGCDCQPCLKERTER